MSDSEAKMTADAAAPEAPEYEVLSFSAAVAPGGRALGLKIVRTDGQIASMLLAGPVVAHLHRVLAGTLRARKGLEELPADAEFFRRMPRWSEGDWADAALPRPIGCEVVTHPDMCRLSFPRGEGKAPMRFRLRPLHAGYLLHAIHDAVENEELDLRVPEAATVH